MLRRELVLEWREERWALLWDAAKLQLESAVEVAWDGMQYSFKPVRTEDGRAELMGQLAGWWSWAARSSGGLGGNCFAALGQLLRQQELGERLTGSLGRRTKSAVFGGEGSAELRRTRLALLLSLLVSCLPQSPRMATLLLTEEPLLFPSTAPLPAYGTTKLAASDNESSRPLGRRTIDFHELSTWR